MSLPLFDEPLIAGLEHCQEFITGEEEAQLLHRLQALDLAPFRFQGWTGKRLTSSYGWRYDFDAGRLEQGEPLPDWLLPIRARAATFAGCVSTISSRRC